MSRLIHAVVTVCLVLAAVGCDEPPSSKDGVTIEWFLGFPSDEPHFILWTIADGQVHREETKGDEVTASDYPAPDPAELDALIEDFVDARNPQLCPDANRVTVTLPASEAEEGLDEVREECGEEGEAIDALLDAVDAGPA